MKLKSMKKNIVIKLGGSSLSNPATLNELAVVVRGYRTRGYNVVVVHGGGPAINEELKSRGITWTFVNGQRRTTPEMIAVIEEVLGSKVNSMVAANLHAAGIPAVGLSGAKDGILFCKKQSEDLGLVGSVEGVDITGIQAVLDAENSPTPVIAPIGFGPNGLRYNVNADWAATKIAIALNAEKLVFLTDQNGILDGSQTLIRMAEPSMIHGLMEEGVISGGMHTKVLAMLTALDLGVQQVRVLNAAKASRVLARARHGTMLVKRLPVVKPVREREVMHGHAS
jgi:acetylglutamate kinase